ncbi:hypothetical protein FRACYDRAFT_244934 [Fragilariopsis cylindrus CCMP1102]|uniref:RNA-binding domain-containing protein n=1 Tax=Fragilariopsis cylindrus CCMP1102 TaxID=635003 RepID=A0A1E7F0Q2_9STRA|nr:hypothetical protein FRACYDRAFT_244934 [Fragilariopsis cylindrus CCMP1102]|eukprot:OEU11810.1 hypothetical protein FRACYDRAFT_244934 [Fragilariopsis cylindrus CCMP1102]
MTNYDEEKHDDAAAMANDDNTDEEKYTHKIYIGRVPTKFTEDTVKRILIEKMMLAGTTGTGTSTDNNDTNIIEKVELIYPHDDDDNNDGDKVPRSSKDKEDEIKKRNLDREHGIDVEHRGFGFIIFSTEKYRDDALKLQTIRGGRKVTSKKLYTMYLRPYVAITYDDNNGGGGDGDNKEEGVATSSSDNANNNNARDICYLWNLHRCPYGNDCKFRHVGIGSCLKKDEDLTPDELKQIKRKRNGKCFLYKKKGKCDKGDECLYSHDFECVVPESERKNDNTKKDDDRSNKSESTKSKSKIPNSLKDCINWKTKGKCRKGDKCVYKHDLELQKIALDKKAIKTKQNTKKRKHDNDNHEDEDDGDVSNKRSNTNSNYQGGNNRREKQPLCVRVFGLNYDTTENDIKEFIQSKLGGNGNGSGDNSKDQNQQHLIKSVLFPKFEDSNRSKGYCGIYFASPKAALDCVSKCDNEELHGRWLRVQTGKSMTIDEWDGLHNK